MICRSFLSCFLDRGEGVIWECRELRWIDEHGGAWSIRAGRHGRKPMLTLKLESDHVENKKRSNLRRSTEKIGRFVTKDRLRHGKWDESKEREEA